MLIVTHEMSFAKEIATRIVFIDKGKIIEERLAKENLPPHFKYDTRLLNASDDDFDKVVKDVKKEYEATLPKGNQTSTVVKTGGTTQPIQTPADAANEAFGQVLGQLVGK